MIGIHEDGQPVSVILQVQLVVLHVRTDLQHLQELPPKNRILWRPEITCTQGRLDYD